MASDAEYLFIYLWTPFMSSLEKYLFRYFAYFLTGLPVFQEWTHVEFFIYFGDQTIVRAIVGKCVFSHVVGSFFILMLFSLAVQKLFVLIKFTLLVQIITER